MTVLIVHPSVSFGQIAAAFRAGGWRGGPVTLTAPLVPGEPEFATWRKDGTVARYDCNPVVWLRVLRLSGRAAPPALQLLSPRDVSDLRRSADPENRMLADLADLATASAAAAADRR